MNIYAGKVPFDSTTDEIRRLFATYGTVSNVHLVTDRITKKTTDFGFVVRENEQQANDVYRH